MAHFRCLTALRFSFDLFGRFFLVCACFQHPKSIITNQKLERPIPVWCNVKPPDRNPDEITVICIEPVE